MLDPTALIILAVSAAIAFGVGRLVRRAWLRHRPRTRPATPTTRAERRRVERRHRKEQA